MDEIWKHPSVVAALIGGVAIVLAAFKVGDVLKELHRRKTMRLRGKLQHVCPHVTQASNTGQTNASYWLWQCVQEERGIVRCLKCGAKYKKSHVIEDYLALERTPPEAVPDVLQRIAKAQKLRKKLDKRGNWEGVNTSN